MTDVSSSREVAIALKRLEVLQRQVAFDPIHLESKPTPKQQQVIDDFGKIRQQWIRAGNQSGKSATCARIVSWVVTDTHPNWNRPANWGSEPLLVIVAGRTGKQIEDSLLPKIRGFLEPGTYKEVRIGNIIQRVELDNGNRIIFQSLENPSTARERLQSYVAHLVWVDELPPTLDIVRELLIRVQARNGYFLASFTPTVVNVDIQRFVDALKEPEGKVYRFHMLDNPLYSDSTRKVELLSRYSHLPEHVRQAIFEGEWLSGDDQVYYFNHATMVEMPNNYSTLWRHVESVDPALKSALGLTVWAEDPGTKIWYCVMAEYVKGIYVPTELVTAVKEKVKHLNIVRRIADPHEVWYIQTAGSMGIHYQGVYKKNERKNELIKQLQQRLGERIRIAPVCEHLIQELQECRWSERSEGRIANASSYHLLDSAQYFCDQIPKAEDTIAASSWEDWLYQQNTRRLAAEEKKRNQIEKKQASRITRRSPRWTR
jgi:phage terminase large subunit-like protein